MSQSIQNGTRSKDLEGISNIIANIVKLPIELQDTIWDYYQTIIRNDMLHSLTYKGRYDPSLNQQIINPRKRVHKLHFNNPSCVTSENNPIIPQNAGLMPFLPLPNNPIHPANKWHEYISRFDYNSQYIDEKQAYIIGEIMGYITGRNQLDKIKALSQNLRQMKYALNNKNNENNNTISPTTNSTNSTDPTGPTNITNVYKGNVSNIKEKRYKNTIALVKGFIDNNKINNYVDNNRISLIKYNYENAISENNFDSIEESITNDIKNIAHQDLCIVDTRPWLFRTFTGSLPMRIAVYSLIVIVIAQQCYIYFKK